MSINTQIQQLEPPEFYKAYKLRLINEFCELNSIIKKSKNPLFHQIFYFHVIDTTQSLLQRPISQSSLQRVYLSSSKNLYKVVFAGSQNRHTAPLQQAFNLFTFIGYALLCTEIAKKNLLKKSDTDSRGPTTDLDRDFLYALRQLATAKGILFRQEDDCTELLYKIGLPDITSWGNYKLLVLEDNDVIYGTIPVKYLFRDSNFFFEIDRDSLTEELKSLRIRIESESDIFLQSYAYNMCGSPGASDPERDYRAYLTSLVRKSQSKRNQYALVKPVYREAFLNHYETLKKKPQKLALLISNIVSHHSSDPLATTIVLFLLELDMRESQRIPSTILYSVWKELLPEIVKKEKLHAHLASNIIALLRGYYDIPAELIGAILFFSAMMMLSLTSETCLEDAGYFQAKLIREENGPMLSVKIQNHSIYFPVTILTWLQAIEKHYFKNRDTFGKDQAEGLLTLFFKTCQPQLLQGTGYPVVEALKECFKKDEDLILPILIKFIQTNDPLLLAISGACFVTLLALNSPKIEFLFELFLSELSAIPQLSALAQQIYEKQKLYRKSSIKKIEPAVFEESEIVGTTNSKNYHEILQAPNEKALLSLIENHFCEESCTILRCQWIMRNLWKVNISALFVGHTLDLLMKIEPLKLHFTFEFLRQIIAVKAVVKEHKESIVDAIITWGEQALIKQGFRSTTIAAICIPEVIASSKAETFLFKLLQELVLERSSSALKKSVKILTKLKLNYDDQKSQRYFERLIHQISIHSKKKQNRSLNYTYLRHELRKLAISQLIKQIPSHPTCFQLLDLVFNSSKTLNKSQFSKLQEICPQLFETRRASIKEAFRWLTASTTPTFIGIDTWFKCALEGMKWVSETKPTNLFSSVQKVWELCLDMHPSDQSLPEAIVNYVLTNQLLILFYKEPLKRWEILKQISGWINQESTLLWSQHTYSIAQQFVNAHQLEYAVEVLIHPMISTQINNPLWNTLLNQLISGLQKEKTEQNAAQLVNIFSKFPHKKSKACSRYVWGIVENSTDKSLVENAYHCFGEKIDLDFAKHTFIAFCNTGSDYLHAFREYPKLTLDILHSINNPHKMCEAYLRTVILQDSYFSEDVFEVLLQMYYSASITPEDLVPIFIYILKSYSQCTDKVLFANAITGIDIVLNKYTSLDTLPCRELFHQFVIGWKPWPLSSIKKIQNCQISVLISLARLFPDELHFSQNCFSNLIQTDKYHFYSTFCSLLNKLLKAECISREAVSKIFIYMYQGIEHLQTFEIETLHSSLTMLEGFSGDSLEKCKAWALFTKKYLDFSENYLTSMVAIKLFFNRFQHFKEAIDETNQAYEALVKTFLNLSIKFNETNNTSNLVKKLFTDLLAQEKNRTYYLQQYLNKFMELMPFETNMLQWIHSEISYWIEEYLTLNPPDYEEILLNYFFHPGSYENENAKNLLTRVEKLPLFSENPSQLQEIELFVFTNSRPLNTTLISTFLRLIDRIAQDFPYSFFRIVQIYNQCIFIPKATPEAIKDQIECIECILDNYKKTAIPSYYSPSSILEPLLYDSTSNYLFGANFKDLTLRFRIISIHKKYFTILNTFSKTSEHVKSEHVNNEVPLIITSTSLCHLSHIISELLIFESDDIETQAKVWNDYHSIIISQFKTQLNSIYPKVLIDTLNSLLKVFLGYSTGSFGITINNQVKNFNLGIPMQQCVLFQDILEIFNELYPIKLLIIEQIVQSLSYMPLLEYWKSTVLIDHFTAAHIKFHKSEEKAFKFTYQNAKKKYEDSLATPMPINQKGHDEICMAHSILFKTLKQVSQEVRNHYADFCALEIEKRCRNYVDKDNDNLAGMLATTALSEEIPLWKQEDQKEFQLQLLSRVLLHDYDYALLHFSVAVKNDLFDGDLFSDIKRTIIKFGIHRLRQFKLKNNTIPFNFELCPSVDIQRYFFEECLSFQYEFWLFPLLKLFPKTLEYCWKLGAQLAFNAQHYQFSAKFITQLREFNPSLYSKDKELNQLAKASEIKHFLKH